MTLITLSNIQKAYQEGDTELHILHGISLEISRGEFVAIMGPSGSGKSTLMHILGCLDLAGSGDYYLDGTLVSGLSADELSELRRKKIGFIFQTFNLIPTLSALENVTLPMIYNRIEDPGARPAELLENVGLGHRLKHFPSQMSGGERQRVAIARALVNDPDIIMADEPTGNLDSKSGETVMEIIERLRDLGKTIVLVTHDPRVSQRASRIIHLKDGLIERIEVLS